MSLRFRFRCFTWVVGAGLCLAVLGCGAAKERAFVPLQEMKGPEWLSKGTGAFTKEKGKAVYAVGVAAGIRNTALLRTTAETRAKANVAGWFEEHVTKFSKDYMASTTAGDMSRSSEEQHVEEGIQKFTSQTLRGVDIVELWQDPNNGDLYALARLDLAAAMEQLTNARELDAKVRDYVRKNADNFHEELAKEEEKRSARM